MLVVELLSKHCLQQMTRRRLTIPLFDDLHSLENIFTWTFSQNELIGHFFLLVLFFHSKLLDVSFSLSLGTLVFFGQNRWKVEHFSIRWRHEKKKITKYVNHHQKCYIWNCNTYRSHLSFYFSYCVATVQT